MPRIIFFGDSITEYGTLTDGYISLLKESLKSKNSLDEYELIGAGIGGDKVYDLYLRLEEDVLNHKPNVVVILIGINDIWHKTSGNGTDAIKFKRFYEAIIKKIQFIDIELILATPTLIGELKDFKNPQDNDLEYYSQIVRELAISNNCKLADLQAVFREYIQQYNTQNKIYGVLTTDAVHLNSAGNQLICDTLSPLLF